MAAAQQATEVHMQRVILKLDPWAVTHLKHFATFGDGCEPDTCQHCAEIRRAVAELEEEYRNGGGRVPSVGPGGPR